MLIFLFLSTLSLRRATPHCYQQTAYFFYFYPRSPCGERLAPVYMICPLRDFYPRSPCGERRRCRAASSAAWIISIHALLAESDSKPRRLKSRRCVFLSTLSLRRATCYSLRYSASCWHFYPRSPCGERPRERTSIKPIFNFYPRSPCGERRPPAPPGQEF